MTTNFIHNQQLHVILSILLMIFISVAHRVHTFLDTEVSNPFSLLMGDSSNLPSGCQPSGTAHVNGHQTTEGGTTVNDTTVNEGSQEMATSSKPFDGSLYYRQSNAMLNGKQRREVGFDEPQRNGRHHDLSHPLSTSSSTQVQIKVPHVVVSSEQSIRKPVAAGRSGNGVVHNSENASYLERLKRSFPPNGSHTTQESLANKFMQRSREASHKKERHNDDTGNKKEHSPKSVSFANSVKGVDKPSKATSPSKEEEKDYVRNNPPRNGSTRNGTVALREHKIQSNVVLSGGLGQSLIGSGFQNGEMKRSFDLKPRQQMAAMERESLLKEDPKYGDSGEVPLPPSPPTRDTNRIPDRCDSQQNSGSVQVLSLYDEHSLFTSNFSRNSGSLPRQSNVSLEFDGSKTLRSKVHVGSALRPKRDQFAQQSNSQVDLTPSRSLRSSGLSRDASLTIEELLSSGSVNSSPENLPLTKFTPQFDRNGYCSKREHSLDDYVDERGNLLQDLRYKSTFKVLRLSIILQGGHLWMYTYTMYNAYTCAPVT